MVGILLAAVAWGAISPAAPASAQSDSDTAELAREMTAGLNEWRLEQSLAPLKVNATLTDLAQVQAEYVASLPELPDDFHAGRQGETPPERAIEPPYNWPSYGRPERTAIGEIAHIGANIDGCIAYWQGSEIHTRTVTNAAYREIGVGVVPHEYGHLFIVVFGARPNVLPALVDPVENMLYTSNEYYSGALSSDDWLHTADQMRLFDAEGRPLSQGWLVWESTLALPDDAGDHLHLAYTDGELITLSAFDLQADRVLLPHTLALFGDEETSTASMSPAATATSVPEATRDESAASDETPAAPSPTPTPVPQATAPSALAPDMRIVYDDRTLTVINVSGESTDISQLILIHPNGELAFLDWQTEWLTAPLEVFPTQDCLQVFGWDEATEPDQPADCRFLRSTITISPDRLFWTFTDFEVYWDDTLLETCIAGAGECAFSLPD